jgi:hypothetical protein
MKKLLFIALFAILASKGYTQTDHHYKYIIYKMTEMNSKTKKVVSETNLSAEMILDLQGNYMLLKAKGLDDWQATVTYGEMVKMNNDNVLKVTLEDPNYIYGYFDTTSKSIYFTSKKDAIVLIFDYSEAKTTQ